MSDNLLRRVRRRCSYCLIIGYQTIRICFYRLISSNSPLGSSPVIAQPVLFLGSGRIRFSKNVRIGLFPSPFFITGICHLEARGETSEIVIGENSHINNNLTIIAEAAKITLGNRCLVGPNVMILDSDFHGLAVADRMITSRANRSSVVVGDDVFIGASVIILKGVTVGDGSVIAAGSVVAKDIPANVIAGGNPARALREL